MSGEAREQPRGLYLVGPGRLGVSLGRAVLAHGLPLAGVAWHSSAGRERARRWLADVPAEPADEPRGAGAAELIVLAVRDDAIGRAAAALRPYRQPGQVVLHTSGLLTAEVLREAGLAPPVGSWHPLQTFADPARGPQRLARCVVAVEGDAAAVSAGRALAEVVASEVVELAAEAKVAYHAAAAVASNYLVVLTGLAARLAGLADIDEARALRMLAPLQRGALDNLGELGVAAALTGPIARGDVETVRAHLALIEARCPELSEAYRALGCQAVALAGRVGADPGRLRGIAQALGMPAGE